MSMSSHQSAASASFDWLTPKDWIRTLGPFDLDPCASVNQPWRTAGVQWTVIDGGLLRPWDGLVWMNPPYGGFSIIAPWMRRLSDHGNGIACIPARTETRCWFDFVWPKARAVLFVKGRPTFHEPVTGKLGKWNSGAPIALIAYGYEAQRRLDACSIEGKLMDLKCDCGENCRDIGGGRCRYSPFTSEGGK